MPYFVEIQVPGSPSREHELLQGPTSIGSGPEVEIRLPESLGFASRHLEITVQEQGALVALAPSVRGSLVFRGKECSEALVPWGEDAYAGNLRLGFLSRSKRAGSPLLLLLAPVLLLAAGMALMPKLKPGLEQGSELDAPPLSQGQIRCRDREPARAEHRAREAEHAGRAKLQRFAFVGSEGIEAMDLLDESASCYAVAGHAADAERLRAEASAWSGRLNEDYAAARLRLRVALDQERYRDALSAVAHLQALLAARPASPYSEWLSGFGRRLEQKIARGAP